MSKHAAMFQQRQERRKLEAGRHGFKQRGIQNTFKDQVYSGTLLYCIYRHEMHSKPLLDLKDHIMNSGVKITFVC